MLIISKIFKWERVESNLYIFSCSKSAADLIVLQFFFSLLILGEGYLFNLYFSSTRNSYWPSAFFVGFAVFIC